MLIPTKVKKKTEELMEGKMVGKSTGIFGSPFVTSRE